MIKIFRLIDRLFWLVWICYPYVFITTVQLNGFAQVGTPPEVCRPWLLDYNAFTPLAVALLWTDATAQFIVWGVGLGLGHWLVHRAAKGRVLVTEIIWPVRTLGLLLLIWPVLQLVLANLVAWSIASVVPGQDYVPIWFPDIVPLGFGMIVIVIATVLSHAVDLARETELTI
jgi:hypothetical protein